MKYLIEIASRTSLESLVEEKHEKFISGLKSISPPWGIVNRERHYPPPDFGKEFIAVMPLKGVLGKELKGEIVYRYRRMLDDNSSDDDHMQIEFNPLKVDFIELINDVFKKYIVFFDAYTASIFNEELVYIDFEKSRNKNLRETIYRFYPVNFFDEQLCMRALKLTPKQVSQRLHGHVEKVELLDNGVIIIGSSKPLTAQESDEIDSKIRKLLIKQ